MNDEKQLEMEISMVFEKVSQMVKDFQKNPSYYSALLIGEEVGQLQKILYEYGFTNYSISKATYNSCVDRCIRFHRDIVGIFQMEGDKNEM